MYSYLNILAIDLFLLRVNIVLSSIFFFVRGIARVLIETYTVLLAGVLYGVFRHCKLPNLDFLPWPVEYQRKTTPSSLAPRRIAFTLRSPVFPPFRPTPLIQSPRVIAP